MITAGFFVRRLSQRRIKKYFGALLMICPVLIKGFVRTLEEGTSREVSRNASRL